MKRPLDREVWNRAGERCEYCRVPQGAYPTPFQIDHVVALKHGGITSLQNLALSCFHCNLHKGPNIAGLDPDTGALTPLFNPRKNHWPAHFLLARDGELKGKTAIGRVTIMVLNMNDPEAQAVRAFLIDEGDSLGDLCESI